MTSAPSRGERRRGRSDATPRRIPVWLETGLLLLVALLVSVLVKTFVLQMFFVPSGSMRPLFVEDDRILVEKWSSWGGAGVERGAVVVFADPGARWLGPVVAGELGPVQTVLSRIGLYPEGGHLVKRVIAVGGDRVRCCDPDGRVSVNGVPLDEQPYLKDGLVPSELRFDVTVPRGRLWVMGDNRVDSEDSRYHQDLPGGGTVPESGVVGRVWAIVWPFDRAGLVATPSTFGDPELATSTGTSQLISPPAG